MLHARGHVWLAERALRCEANRMHNIIIFCEGFELEHACRDPKDGELCLSGAKPEETLVEA
jgi:hypothetical protein